MNLSAPSPFKSVGLLAFLATGIIGWQLATPSAPATEGEISMTSVTKRAPRPARPSRSAAANTAGKRMASLRALADPEARMLASISLAESLSPTEFAAWMNGGWFNLRGGPELMIFSKVLLERWLREAPEDLMAWAAQNNSDAANGLMDEWAAHEPQRLIDYFKSHRDDRRELEMLEKIAVSSPALALQRLREMADAGIVAIMRDKAGGMMTAPLMKVLAANSPAALEALLESMPSEMKIVAEGALSKLRLDASFEDEIRNLQGRKDGWKIFSTYLAYAEDIGPKLLGVVASFSPEWRSGLVNHPWGTASKSNAQQWWDADLEGAGFSSSQAKLLRIQALLHLAPTEPETTLERMSGLKLESHQVSNILSTLFSSVADPEKARELIAGLPNQEARDAATAILDRRTAPRAEGEVTTPADLFAKLATEKTNNDTYFSQIKNWPPEKVTALSAGFSQLPEEQKQQLSHIIIDTMEASNPPANLRDEVVRYYAENPTPKNAISEEPWKSPNAAISQYVVNLSTNDPLAASQWVESLPASNTKAWAQKNLLSNWQQYDPKAADRWEKSLPEADRAALKKLK